MDVQDGNFHSPSHEGERAQVFSLSLHRLQRAPRAVHRAFLSRPSVFRPLRNIRGVYQADGLSFLKDRAQSELCFMQMINQAQESVLVIGGERDDILQNALAASRAEKPHVKIREMAAAHFILVVDERVALLGTGDLAIVVEGSIARQISDLFQISIHTSAQIPRGRTSWPLRTRLDLESVEVGLSRTWTSRDLPPTIEVERLLLSAIKSAKRFVYIEAEQLTSPVVARAIISRLKWKDGPEFVILLPPSKAFLQTAVIARILKSDEHAKFHVFERPQENGQEGSLLIVDDQFLKIGTSQLTSKSLGALNEVDLSIEALGRPHIVMAIARLRRERIGRFLKLDPSEFDARFLLNGSLTDTIESFFTSSRRWPEISPEATPSTQIAATFAPLIDPKRPRALQRWVRKKLRYAPKYARFAVFLVIIFALLITFASLFAPFGL